MNRTRLALFLFFQALYALTSSGNVFRLPDEFEVYFQVERLIDAGDLSVPQALEITQGSSSVFFGRIGIDGKPYAPYGPLVAVLAVPHHLLGRGLAAVMGIGRVPRAQGLAWLIFVGGVTMLAAATAAALTVAGFHRAVIALGTPAPMALGLSIVLGGATVLWPYGTSFFSEAFLAAAFIWAAVMLIEARRAQHPSRRIVLAAALIIIAGLTKVTSLIMAPAFVAAVLAETRISWTQRTRVALALGGAIGVAAAMQLGWNAYRFGSPFEFGYDWTETIPVMPARAFSVAELPRGIAVLLFAPGKSLLLWAPILLVSLLNAADTWRRDRGLAAGALTAFALGVLVYGAYLFPEGGYAHGPRHVVPIVPLLALLAAAPDLRTHSRTVLRVGAVIGVVLAVTATRVSYLEDQALRRDRMGRPVPNYYEVIDPAPGRASNRYRFGHIPFVTAMSSNGWSESPVPGLGPDYFFRHLRQARLQLRDGMAIPEPLTWIWPATWTLLAFGAAAFLVRQYGEMTEPARAEFV
ncbi:MAG: hypothetical protein FJW22_05000 [Acidimicrobiia bacterium]|nr:hypothetical protein [Acidimicrobiia bacterium]